MSVTRKIVFVAALFSIVAPAFAQANNQTNSSATQRQKVPIKRAVVRDDNPYGWKDSRLAPSFPIPVFRGNHTQFMRLCPTAEASLAEANKMYNGRNLTLITDDSADTVYKWYTKFLPESGYKLDEKLSKQTGSGYYVTGNSAKECATAAVTPKRDPNAGCQIELTVRSLTPVKK